MTTHPHAPRRLILAAALGLVLGPPPAATATSGAPLPDDAGTFRVFQKDKLLGTENFWYLPAGPEAIILSNIRQLLPRPGGTSDSLLKQAQLRLAYGDHDLRGYESQQIFGSDKLRRELVMEDTTYNSYRQGVSGGVSDVFVRPPGRIYVVDPQVFALFDVLCRDLHGQDFEERPVTFLYLAGRDTSVEARVTRLGTEEIRLRGRVFKTQKLGITDPWSTFLVWVSESGRMLRLTLPQVGLRVERDPKTLAPNGGPPLSSATAPAPVGPTPFGNH